MVGAATGLRPAPLLAGVAAAGVLVATVMTGPDAGAEVRTGRISVAYSCLLPSGTGRLTATMVQDYPVAATAGAPVQPGPLTLRAAVPRGLLPAAATVVSGTAALEVAVGDGTASAAGSAEASSPAASTAPGAAASTATGAATAGSAAPGAAATDTATAANTQGSATRITLRTSAGAVAALAAQGAAAPRAAGTAEWAGLTVAPVRLGTADPVLTATGQVPALTAGKSGTSITVTPLTLALTLQAGGGTVRLQCAPARQAPPLGSVSVVGAPSAGAGAGAGAGASAGVAGPAKARAVVRADQEPVCSASPTGSLDPADLPTPPPGSVVLAETDSGVECAVAIGYANVAKLGEASLVNVPPKDPALAILAIQRLAFNYGVDPIYLELDEIGNLTLPPADTTFLTYGFIPTTARMQLIPQGNLTVVETGQGAVPVITTIYGKQTLRLYDVEVDGTPLDVGNDCHTVSPLQLRLQGVSLAGLPVDPDPTRDYTITGGGPLSQDQLTIPYFTGCGPHGSLDPLFDAAVSGGGNSLNLAQGPVCFTFSGPCTTFTMPVLPVRAPKPSK